MTPTPTVAVTPDDNVIPDDNVPQGGQPSDLPTSDTTIPDDDAPATVLPEDPVPQADAPVIIPDDDTPQAATPQTGDNSHVELLSLLAAISAGALVVLNKIGTRKNQRSKK